MIKLLLPTNMNKHHKITIRKKVHRQLGWTGIIKNRWINCGGVWRNFPDSAKNLIAVRPMSGPTGIIFYMNLVSKDELLRNN